jgi:hypothetical protein
MKLGVFRVSEKNGEHEIEHDSRNEGAKAQFVSCFGFLATESRIEVLSLPNAAAHRTLRATASNR